MSNRVNCRELVRQSCDKMGAFLLYTVYGGAIREDGYSLMAGPTWAANVSASSASVGIVRAVGEVEFIGHGAR